ncbi:hypothetical protein QTP88_000693 [Uroleucon formosanum]
MSEPNIVEVSSSDDEEIISTINTGSSDCSSTLDLQCSICLGKIKNPSHPDECLHSFCLRCLRRWAARVRVCPLCKATFTYIILFNDKLDDNETSYEDLPDENSSDDDSMGSGALQEYNSNDNSLDLTSHSSINGQAMRTRVYIINLWSRPIQDTTSSIIRDCSPDFYRDNPVETFRLHIFILREVIAVRETLRLANRARSFPGETNVTVTNLIMRSILVFDIRQLHLIDTLKIFLDQHVEHFCHEVYNFANSPYDISEYDRHIQHLYRPLLTESIESLPINSFVQNSQYDVLQRSMIVSDVSFSTDDSDVESLNHSNSIVQLNSTSLDQPSTSTGIRDSLNQSNNSSDDSDVVILNHVIHPIKPLNYASIEQPSTSTRIRDSLNRPNNRIQRIFSLIVNCSSSFKSVDGSSSPCLSLIRKESPNSDSSSDDEDSLIATQGFKTAHIKSRDVLRAKGGNNLTPDALKIQSAILINMYT